MAKDGRGEEGHIQVQYVLGLTRKVETKEIEGTWEETKLLQSRDPSHLACRPGTNQRHLRFVLHVVLLHCHPFGSLPCQGQVTGTQALQLHHGTSCCLPEPLFLHSLPCQRSSSDTPDYLIPFLNCSESSLFDSLAGWSSPLRSSPVMLC